MKCKNDTNKCRYYDCYINSQKHAIEYCKRKGKEIREIEDVDNCDKYVDVTYVNYYRRDLLREI